MEVKGQPCRETLQGLQPYDWNSGMEDGAIPSKVPLDWHSRDKAKDAKKGEQQMKWTHLGHIMKRLKSTGTKTEP